MAVSVFVCRCCRLFVYVCVFGLPVWLQMWLFVCASVWLCVNLCVLPVF